MSDPLPRFDEDQPRPVPPLKDQDGATLTRLVAVMRRLAVREEVGLEAAFGDPYRRYKARVPQWIGLPGRARTEAEPGAAADRPRD